MKHSGDQRRHLISSEVSKADELVKYMSNLPGYLQQMDKDEKLQGKVLNFGVLDWERLEKWKQKQTRMSSRHSMNNNASTGPSSSFNATVHGKILAQNRYQTHLHRSSPGSGTDLFPVGRKKVIDGKKYGTCPPGSGTELFPFGRKKVMDGQKYGSSSQLSDAGKKLQWEAKPSEDNSSATMIERENNHLDRRISSETGTSSKNGIASKRLTSSKGDAEERMEDVCLEFSSQNYQGIHQNIVLLLPKDSPQHSCSETPRSTSMSRKSFSDSFCSQNVQTDEPHYEVSHSCPLSHGPEINDSSSDGSVCSAGKYSYKSKAKASNPTVLDTPRRLDREFSDMMVGKGKILSPTHQLGNALGRVNRNFSAKGSPEPQVTSSSASPGQLNRPKSRDPSRGRSSPLRRLLDPLLKPKVLAHVHSADDKPPQGKLNLAKPSDVASIVHALVQLTFKNGLPLFKFVVDDSGSDILAATVKVKEDPSWAYTFYSVREMPKKKSGGWMNQGTTKERNCGYACNVVGEMKISSGESVLFGAKPESTPRRELAAIVDKDRRFNSEGRCLWCGEKESCSNVMAVIMPDGVHGFPREGVPTPLIDRWKAGGPCDCGGWDLGCKLKVLGNCDGSNKVQGSSAKPCPGTHRFDLFMQGRRRERWPIFSLAPVKNGICSVKFNASVSRLQAFSICVAVMGRDRSLGALGALGNGLMSKERWLDEASSEMVHGRSLGRGGGEAGANYSSLYPPYSPAGRI